MQEVKKPIEASEELQVDISDALSEREKVKFTVHTKSSLEEFDSKEYSVVREHEEFIWLHEAIEEDRKYAGYIIPPPPPRPDFEASREKLQRLGEGEGSMTKDEFAKMKAELEAEYLATFKKTVAMHEMFLQRLACHAVFKNDNNFKIFLTYADDLAVRTKNKKEMISKFFVKLNKSADDFMMSPTVSDRSDSFDPQKHFLISYQSHVENAYSKADKMTQSHKRLADNYIRISMQFLELSKMEAHLRKFMPKLSDGLEKTRKCEGRACTDVDLKLSDILKYYYWETGAARDLMQRRVRCLSDFENANKMLERARFRDRDVRQAEETQREACQNYERITESMEKELVSFRTRRIQNFKKSLVELAELQVKHNKSATQMIRNCLLSLKSEMVHEEM